MLTTVDGNQIRFLAKKVSGVVLSEHLQITLQVSLWRKFHCKPTSNKLHMSTNQIRLCILTDTVAVLVCGNRLIEKTIEHSKTIRSGILITLLPINDGPRDRISWL